MDGARPRWAVFLLMNDLDALGGSSQLFCTIALQLQMAGHDVAVYTDHPSAADNRYARRLREAGIPVNPGVSEDVAPGVLRFLLLPARLALALVLTVVYGRAFAPVWQRIGERLDRWLVHRRFNRWGRRAFVAAVGASRRGGHRVLAHVHRGANGVRWAHAAGLPVVYVENSTPMAGPVDGWFAIDPSPGSHAARGWRRLRRVSRWIDVIAAGSQRAAQGIREQVRYTGTIAVLPWMVDSAAVQPQSSRYDSTAPLIIGTAGRLESEKGHVFLVEALPLVLRAASVRLVVAGAGSLRNRLETLASELGVRQYIEFLGAQDDAGMERFWGRIDLLVLPSLREGSPLAALEAMARRIAVVATDVGGVSELLDHGRCGRTAAPGAAAALADAILELATDAARRQRSAEAGYERFMAMHAPAVAMPLWLQTYARVLDDWDERTGPGLRPTLG